MIDEVVPQQSRASLATEPVSKLVMTTSRKRRRLEANVLASTSRYRTMKSVAGESKIHTGVPLLDEQAVFQAPNPTTPNEKLLSDLGKNLVLNQRRMVELESAVHEAWTMREMLAVQILASQGAVGSRSDCDNMEGDQKSAAQQGRSKGEWKEGVSAGRRYWSETEHIRFLEGIVKYGVKNVREIAQAVGSRNATQVRTHLQKYMLRRDEWDRRFQPREEILGDLDQMLAELQNMSEATKRQKDANMDSIMNNNHDHDQLLGNNGRHSPGLAPAPAETTNHANDEEYQQPHPAGLENIQAAAACVS